MHLIQARTAADARLGAFAVDAQLARIATQAVATHGVAAFPGATRLLLRAAICAALNLLGRAFAAAAFARCRYRPVTQKHGAALYSDDHATDDLVGGAGGCAYEKEIPVYNAEHMRSAGRVSRQLRHVGLHEEPRRAFLGNRHVALAAGV